jgi:hypothetical protein
LAGGLRACGGAAAEQFGCGPEKRLFPTRQSSLSLFEVQAVEETAGELFL